MPDDFLTIALKFKTKQVAAQPQADALNKPADTVTAMSQQAAGEAELLVLTSPMIVRNKRIYEFSSDQSPSSNDEPLNVAAMMPSLEEEEGVYTAYDHKATIAGQQPPYERVLQEQAWLATIDWRAGYGLRCGKTGHQCRVCRGLPCRDSTEWSRAKNETKEQGHE